jgi:hypothetical protein
MSSTITTYRKEPFVLQDKNDSDKKLKIDLSNLTDERTISFPDQSGTFLLLADVQNRNDNSATAGIDSNFNATGTNQTIPFKRRTGSTAMSSTTSYYTVPVSGLYTSTCNVRMDGSGSGGSWRVSQQVDDGSGFTTFAFSLVGNHSYGTTILSTKSRKFNAGDIIRIRITQSSTANINVHSGDDNTYWTIVYHGPMS